MPFLSPEATEQFLKYDYGETKDLLKAFITLISATLVFSLTFSDKIAVMDNSKPMARGFVFGAWTSFFAALALAGGALLLIAASAGCVLYDAIPFFTCGYWTFAVYSWVAGVVAGGLYALGLLCLVVAAWLSYLPRSPDVEQAVQDDSCRNDVQSDG